VPTTKITDDSVPDPSIAVPEIAPRCFGELTPDGALVLFAKDVKASRLLVALAAVDDATRELLKTSVSWDALYRDSDLLKPGAPLKYTACMSRELMVQGRGA
jgi:hypothetical protein